MHSHQDDERRLAGRGVWSSLIVNAALTVGKGGVGLIAGSQALFADAVHSGADLVGSIAVLVGLRVARKPPDEDHPYGHGKAELLSSSIVAALLIAAALDVGVSSVRSLWRLPHTPYLASAYAAMAAVIVKEIMYQYNYRIGKRLNSKSLMASALDHRSDVFSSIAALVGIGLSLVGHWAGIKWLLRMDSIAGAFVSVLILKIGYDILQDSAQLLMDRVVQGEPVAEFEQTILSVAGVEHIDELRVRDHGQYLLIDVEISVNAQATVAAGHEIAARVKQGLMQTFPRIHDVLVHVNPYYPDEREDDSLD